MTFDRYLDLHWDEFEEEVTETISVTGRTPEQARRDVRQGWLETFQASEDAMHAAPAYGPE